MFKPENQLARFELSFLCYLILLHLKKKKLAWVLKVIFLEILNKTSHNAHNICEYRQIKYS